MKNAFLIYAAIVVLFSSAMSWRVMLGSATGGSGSGGSWSSYSTGGGGWASSGGGGHK